MIFIENRYREGAANEDKTIHREQGLRVYRKMD